jgi:sigma-B regulation protein RsbU (phosphoserine phosphatase)
VIEGGGGDARDLGEAYEHAACGLMTISAEGAILRVSATMCAYTGFSEAELLGRTFQSLLTIGSKLFHQTHWFPLLQLQGSVAEVQLELRHHDGRVLPVLVNAARRPSTGGGRALVDIAMLVVTDRRKYERELLRARKQAEELLDRTREAESARALAQARVEEALRHQEAEAQQRAVLAEQLIGIVSHDLRNPLNAVMLGAELLADGDLGENAHVVRRITSSAARANRLIGDLLDFTQARLGGGLRVARRPIDLHAVVADCLEEVKMAWPGRVIEHRRRGEGESRGDADRLAQVVTNLVNNALVYGTPTEPVTVTSALTETGLELHVHNAGAPIPDDLRPQMFEPLRRGEHEARLGSRSVGLGLYIVREIAAAHGGHIALHSTAEGGTTFTLTAPRG